MEFLSRYFSQIKSQLTGLSISQRLLIGTLVVVILGTIFFVVEFSRKPEMVELLPGVHSTPDEVAVMSSYLKGKYQVQVEGDKILVPAEEAYLIRGELGAAQALPKDTTAAFGKLIEDANPFRTDADNDRRWNYARQEVLGKVIRAFPYVADATVIVSKGQDVGLGRAGIPSSASVSVRTKGGDGLTSSQVLAIVDTIRGAVAGLKREDVHVTDGARAYTAPSEGSPMPTDLLAFKKCLEDDLTRKLYVMFASLGDVKIAVNVVPDMSARTSSTQDYDPKRIAKAPVEETTRDVTPGDGASAGGQPGVVPNAGMSAGTASAGSSGGGGGSANDAARKYEVRFSASTEQRVTPPGTEVKKMTASISLPRSYFVKLFQRMKKDPKADPEDGQLAEIIKDQSERVQKQALAAIGAETPEQVRVDWFDDAIVARAETAVATAGGGVLALGGGSISGLVAQYAKQVVLGSVALGGLLVMLMMVRRSAPGMAGAEADTSVFLGGFGGGGKKRKKPGDPHALDVDEDVIGEANQGDAVLTGIELDDETLQSRKMVDEVSTMIRENPENAAALVKRWLSKGK